MKLDRQHIKKRSLLYIALGWRPEGRRKGDAQKRMVEVERNKAVLNSWNTARREASDRNMWKSNVQALCA